MTKRLVLAAVLAASFPPAAMAVTTGPIVVTPTRTAQTVDETLAPVTVITREDIETRQLRSVEELLRAEPGISVSNSGGAGKTTSVFMRGTESDHVLVLVDGVKVGSATLGTTPFQDLPVEGIERVEIVRGPRSHLYGSEAIGGVIQIYTRKGGGELTPRASVGVGSFGSRNGTFGLSGGGDDAWFDVSASSERTDGFNACDGEPNVGGCFADEPDDDGYDSDSFSVRAGTRFEGGAELDFNWLKTDNEAEFDGQFQDESQTEQEVGGASLRLAPGDSSVVTARIGRSKDESTNFKDGVFASRFDTERDSASVQGDFIAGDDHIVTLGVDYLDDKVDSDLDFIRTSRDNVGVFAQYQGMLGDYDLQLGLRQDDNEQYGTHATGGITVGRRLEGGRRVTLAYGTAFKAPSFNELYFPNFGNPDLDPEESDSVEFGLTGADNRWSVHVFDTDIDEMIGFDPDTFASVNIDAARIRGVEFSARADIADWRMNAALTLLDPENRGVSFNGKVLPRRAEESLRVELDRDFGRYSAGATLIAEGSKFDDLANSRKIDGYATVDLRFAMKLAGGWRTQLKVENLFDKDYESASYFNQPGRSAFLVLRYSPERD